MPGSFLRKCRMCFPESRCFVLSEIPFLGLSSFICSHPTDLFNEAPLVNYDPRSGFAGVHGRDAAMAPSALQRFGVLPGRAGAHRRCTARRAGPVAGGVRAAAPGEGAEPQDLGGVLCAGTVTRSSSALVPGLHRGGVAAVPDGDEPLPAAQDYFAFLKRRGAVEVTAGAAIGDRDGASSAAAAIQDSGSDDGPVERLAGGAHAHLLGGQLLQVHVPPQPGGRS